MTVVANKEEQTFSWGVFFKGIGDWLYAWWVSAGEAMQGLYKMFVEEVMRKGKAEYSAVSADLFHCDEEHLNGLLSYYDERLKDNHRQRVFQVSHENTEAHALMEALQKGEDWKDKMYTFILSFIHQRRTIRHMDFSGYFFEGAARDRFEFFLSEFLSVHSEITQISFHPSNAEYFSTSPVVSCIHRHRQLASAYRLLTDNREKQHPLANPTTLAFFKKYQGRVVEKYTEKTTHFLNIITPEDKKESIRYLSNWDDNHPIDITQPWHFIAWAGRELKNMLSSVSDLFRKSPTPAEQQLISVAPERDLRGYTSTMLTLFSSAANTITNLLSSKKKESSFYFLNEKDPKEKQLAEVTKEAERIIALWKIYEENQSLEPISERIALQAKLVTEILYRGLLTSCYEHYGR